MVAMPAEAAQPSPEFPWRPPFTVDLLFELPDTGLRYEVLEGALVVTPAPEPRHNRAADRLTSLFNSLLSVDVEAITGVAVRMPNGYGPIPDV